MMVTELYLQFQLKTLMEMNIFFFLTLFFFDSATPNKTKILALLCVKLIESKQNKKRSFT